MSPYRSAELVAPETFPWWQRALAWWFSPEFGAQFRFYHWARNVSASLQEQVTLLEVAIEDYAQGSR